MPAASNQTTMVGPQTDFKAETMDHLVKEITKNLKLGCPGDIPRSPYSDHGASAAALKLKNFRRGQHRSSPYAVPPSSRACDTTLGSSPTSRGSTQVSQLRKWNHQRRRYPSTCMTTDPIRGAHGGTNGVSVGPGVAGAASKLSNDVGEEDDPFKMLQELISDGGLIKEAVKRLQEGMHGYTPSDTPSKTFYDSEDDECGRTPPNPYSDDLCFEVGV